MHTYMHPKHTHTHVHAHVFLTQTIIQVGARPPRWRLVAASLCSSLPRRMGISVVAAALCSRFAWRPNRNYKYMPVNTCLWIWTSHVHQHLQGGPTKTHSEVDFRFLSKLTPFNRDEHEHRIVRVCIHTYIHTYIQSSDQTWVWTMGGDLWNVNEVSTNLTGRNMKSIFKRRTEFGYVWLLTWWWRDRRNDDDMFRKCHG